MVKVRPFRSGGFEVDIRLKRPDGSTFRDRLKAPVTSKSGAQRWGEARERELLEALIHGVRDPRHPAERKEVPTLGEFKDRFLQEYAEAERLKPSSISAMETILRVRLVPLLGSARLDEIGNEDVQRIKVAMRDRKPKTVNNTLAVLSKLLNVAVDWTVIDEVPCKLRMLPTPPTHAEFLDFDEYTRLVDAARLTEARAHLIVLLGGDAGLRCGEMQALKWPDVDLGRRQLRIQRSEWAGRIRGERSAHLTAPKGGRSRVVPMTQRLADALRTHRHLRSERVLCQEGGSPVTQKIVQSIVRKVARRANLAKDGVHLLRHTFCSHLAMRGTPASTIQAWAGHADLSTTQRYMHLSPRLGHSAIRCLEEAPPAWWQEAADADQGPADRGGDIVETRGSGTI